MASGFRDSFTKEDTKEDLLGYDDTAFHYFAVSVLSCVAVPWTISLAHAIIFPERQAEKFFPLRSADGNDLLYPRTADMVEKSDRARREARRCTTGSAVSWAVRSIVLVAMWAVICGMVLSLGQEKDIRKFDPHDILDVSPQATNQVIKKAYRKLSLAYHPDKNRDDPLAASRFIQITKAYQALTDEVARRNWEKYGNPDGAQTTKVGIGLPKVLLEKDNNLLILCAFFFVLLFVVPMTFICYYQQTKNYAANGVMIETLQFLGYYINPNTRLKHCPELLAACGESRSMKTRPTDNLHLKAFRTSVHEHKKRSFTIPAVAKNQYLVWAHMQRQHGLMSPELRADVDELLSHSMRISQAMIEIACMRELFLTVQAIIEFRRCLVQALDIKTSQLLQIPHFTEELVEKCSAAAAPGGGVSTLAEFFALDVERRKSVLSELQFDPQQLADVDAFCAHVGEVEIDAEVKVEDEPEIVVGDVATVSVRMVRKNLREDQAMGAANAPLFPEPKFEEWWFFLVDPAQESQPRIVAFERVTNVTRFVEQHLRFQVIKAGENKLVLHVLCDSYAGLDEKVELSFNAASEDECKREFKVLPEDEELDHQLTLFQQWMGELPGEEESEDEDADEQDGGASSSSGESGGNQRSGADRCHDEKVSDDASPSAPPEKETRREDATCVGSGGDSARGRKGGEEEKDGGRDHESSGSSSESDV